MEAQSIISIYKPVLVIEHFEIGGSTARVTCIECCGSRMFIGTAEGLLIEYFIRDEKSNIHFTKVRHTDLQNKSQPVQYIRAATAIDSLLVLSGNYLALLSIQSLEIKGSNGIKNITAISVDENPVSGDPFVVEFCFSRKTSIQLGLATTKGFSLTRDISVDSVALTLSMESGLICAALANGYYIMINSFLKSSKPIKLCTFDTHDKPLAVHVTKEEFLVVGPGGLGVFVTKDATSERPPICWPDKVSKITVHSNLNVVGMGQDVIYVHSLVDYQTCHTIPFRGLLRCLSLSEGNLYVVSSKSLFKLNPISVEQQIETLLSSDEIEKALNLLLLSHLKVEDHQVLEQKIQRKAVFVYMANLDFESAAASMVSSFIDLREVFSLFPNMLPANSTFTRTLPPLHNFVDIKDMTKNNETKERQIGAFLTTTLINFESVSTSQDLSTAFFKLAALYDHTDTFQNLLNSVHQLPLDFPDLLKWLESQKFYSSAGNIYVKIGELKKALNFWIAILEGKLICAKEDTFPGISIIVDTLVDTIDSSIVWPYFEKLTSIDPTSAVEIFTRKPISFDYPPLKVAEKLRKWPIICILYLEHCVTVKDIQDEDCHTYLAALYIDCVLGDGDRDVTEEYRLKLRQFLIDSNCLKLQFLIGRLSNTHLRLELAILHGKAGDHKPALLVFTTELKDHKMARDYCTKLKRREDRRDAFLILLEICLEKLPQTDEVDAKHENVVKVLTDFSEEFDVSLVLPMLPDHWSLQLVSNVLFRAVRHSIHKRRQAQLLAGLSRRISIDCRVRSLNGNQGYIIDNDSICEVCHKSFDLTDPIFCKQGFVVHEKCK